MTASESNFVIRLMTSSENQLSTEQLAIQDLLVAMLMNKSDTELIVISGEIITYVRDTVLKSLASVRRVAAGNARSVMSPDDIVKATGLSKQTVSRLITERNLY